MELPTETTAITQTSTHSDPCPSGIWAANPAVEIAQPSAIVTRGVTIALSLADSGATTADSSPPGSRHRPVISTDSPCP